MRKKHVIIHESMRFIPAELRDQLEQDEFMQKCCLANDGLCSGVIEWHHNFIYAGRQVNEYGCILPLCKYHHSIEKQRAVGDRLDVIMLTRISEDEMSRFPKVDFKQWRKRLGLL